MAYPEMFFRARNPNDKRPFIARTFTYFYGKIGEDGTGTFTDVRTMHWDDTPNSINTFNNYLRQQKLIPTKYQATTSFPEFDKSGTYTLE